MSRRELVAAIEDMLKKTSLSCDVFVDEIWWLPRMIGSAISISRPEIIPRLC